MLCTCNLHDFPVRAGADLRENSSVSDAVFDPATGLWAIHLENTDTTFTARVSLKLASYSHRTVEVSKGVLQFKI